MCDLDLTGLKPKRKVGGAAGTCLGPPEAPCHALMRAAGDYRHSAISARDIKQQIEYGQDEAACAGTTPTTVVKLTALDGSAIRNQHRILVERVKLKLAMSRPDNQRPTQAANLIPKAVSVERANEAEGLMRSFRGRKRRQPLDQRAENGLADTLRRL